MPYIFENIKYALGNLRARRFETGRIRRIVCEEESGGSAGSGSEPFLAVFLT